MSVISASGISKRVGGEHILRNVSFRLERGDHVALVGANDAGNSALLRIIAGLEEPDSGEVSRTRGLRIAYLPQEPDFGPSGTLYEAMLDVFSETIEAQERLRTLETEIAASTASPATVGEYRRLQAMSKHAGDYRERIERVLTALGLERDVWYLPTEQLSGGQRPRANLARTLLNDADVLLLDEPTNHLDLASREALQRILAEFQGTLLFVSHDRYLIDALARELWVVEDGNLARYAGPYSDYVAGRARPLDRERRLAGRTAPAERRRQLEEAVESLSGRLAAIGSTATPAQLTELMDRYQEALTALEEADSEWLISQRASLVSSV